jgi:hypothetical protein
MEEDYKIGPGTAGLAQRISSEYELKQKDIEEKLYVLKQKILMPCGHNQY